MGLSLTNYVNTTLTIIIVPLTLSPLWILWVVRLEDTVNLCVFYFCSLIEKLTVFLKLQEFNLCNPTPCTITVARCSPHIDGVPITFRSHSPITLSNLSSLNLVSIFRCSSPPHNPVYPRRVDPSTLVFSLQVHYTDSYISILFSSRLIYS